ncbi:MAG TPA: hypothetical protein VK663_01125 [Burkholderiales bacterium]|nr:hypothetical protein [Burkholderiales bacterium]
MNFLKISSGIDVMPLAMELARQPELWNQITTRLAFAGSPHRESDDIWMRYKDQSANIASGDFSDFADEHDPIWYPAFYKLPSSAKFIFDLMAYVKAERLGGVIIYRVQPGKQIYLHADQGWHPEYYDKFNLAIQSQPGCAFYYPDQGEAMEQVTGDMHWFRNTVRHGVINKSDHDQIIMTVCVRTHASGSKEK